jgi:Na+/H+-dicarboxylate symporter
MEWFLVPWASFSAIGFVAGVFIGSALEENAGVVIASSLGGAWLGLWYGFLPSLMIFAMHLIYASVS